MTFSVVENKPSLRLRAVSNRPLRCYEQLSELTSERDRIDRVITELISSRDVLHHVIDAASGHSGSNGPSSPVPANSDR